MRFNKVFKSQISGMSFIGMVIFVFSHTSCSNEKNEKNISNFTEGSFEEIHRFSNKIIYENDDLLLGNPRWVRVHPDSFLIVQEMGTPKLIKIIDLKTNSVQEIITKGRGPGEMIVAWGIELLENDLYVYGGQLRKIIKLTPDKNRLFHQVNEFIIEEKVTGMYPLEDHKFFSLSPLGSDYRVMIFNDEGKVLKYMGDYPPLLNKDNIKSDNDIFQSTFTATPDGKRFLLACTNTDVLEIYDAEDGLIKRFQGPLGIKLTAYMKDMGIGTMISTDPWYATYSSAVAKDNEFWVSYNGLKGRKGVRPSLSELHPLNIFCFDLDGNPLRKLVFESPLLSFDIDWMGKLLYSIELHNEVPQISVYDLNGIFK